MIGAVLIMAWLYFGPLFLRDILGFGGGLAGTVYSMVISVFLMLAVFVNIAHYRKKHRGALSKWLYFVAAALPYLVMGSGYIKFIMRAMGSE